MKKSMLGEARKAIKVAFGNKFPENGTAYNDYTGRKTMPNKRDLKFKSCFYDTKGRSYWDQPANAVTYQPTDAEVSTLRRSLAQRMKQFDLEVHSVYAGGGGIYIELWETV